MCRFRAGDHDRSVAGGVAILSAVFVNFPKSGSLGIWAEIELEREADGRWIAEIPAIGGCMAYGATADAARVACVALARRLMLEMDAPYVVLPDLTVEELESARTQAQSDAAE